MFPVPQRLELCPDWRGGLQSTQTMLPVIGGAAQRHDCDNPDVVFTLQINDRKREVSTEVSSHGRIVSPEAARGRANLAYHPLYFQLKALT